MPFPLRVSLLCLLVAVLTGCAHKHNTLVALVPDPDGEVGNVTVTNAAGSVDISVPFQATTVADAAKHPEAPKFVNREDLLEMFADALSMEPMQPLAFLLCFVRDTRFRTESLKVVPAIVGAIRDKDSIDITVVGHADTLASMEYNADLSIDRALAAKELLVSHGVDPSTISTYGQGEEVPLVPTKDEVYEPRNRCTEVIVR